MRIIVILREGEEVPPETMNHFYKLMESHNDDIKFRRARPASKCYTPGEDYYADKRQQE